MNNVAIRKGPDDKVTSRVWNRRAILKAYVSIAIGSVVMKWYCTKAYHDEWVSYTRHFDISLIRLCFCQKCF